MPRCPTIIDIVLGPLRVVVPFQAAVERVTAGPGSIVTWMDIVPVVNMSTSLTTLDEIRGRTFGALRAAGRRIAHVYWGKSTIRFVAHNGRYTAPAHCSIVCPDTWNVESIRPRVRQVMHYSLAVIVYVAGPGQGGQDAALRAERRAIACTNAEGGYSSSNNGFYTAGRQTKGAAAGFYVYLLVRFAC